MEKQKQSKRKLIIILMIILILLLSICLIFLITEKGGRNFISTEKEVSDNQSAIDLDFDHHESEEGYTEVMGFGCLDIDKDYPFIYLINPDGNEVYLSFDVYKDDQLLYSSDLIEPGKMIKFNIFECLNAGKHTLVYSIASYDLKNRAVLWSGINQKQDISITK